MTKEPLEPICVNVPETQRLLGGAGRSRVYELLATREIESIKIGRSRKVLLESLRAYVARQREAEAAR
jgi:hypothetical protein